ncbi:MAG: hypothetical protein IT330_07030 [Anaerolineae bacterium]|nr:hypothetical protein [Anaerolineae bacterium]
MSDTSQDGRGVYRGQQLRAVAMPLGGLGAGQIALCGDGSLRQWQIFNQVNHQAFVPDSFFAVWVRSQGRRAQPVARVLHSAETYDETGFSPAPLVTDHVVPPALKALLGKLPGVQRVEFTGEYPLAHVDYVDDALPVKISLDAFSPFIPLNEKDSGLPAIFVIFTLAKPGEKPVEVSLAATLQNAAGWDGIVPILGMENPLYGGNRNLVVRLSHLTALDMGTTRLPTDDPGYGQMVLAALSDRATCLSQWDNLDAFWHDFAADGALTNHVDATPSPAGRTWNGALAVPVTMEPGQRQQVRFVLSWYFPNHYVNWNQVFFGVTDTHSRFWIGNMYNNWFSSALAVAEYGRDHFARLTEETRRFRDTFYDSTLPYYLLDAVTSQASTMRSPTCFWAADGKFYGFEGCNGASTGNQATGGCCPMNCTHVWNYEQALAKLFPGIERTMRETDLGPQLSAEGGIPHRTVLPLYLPRWSKPSPTDEVWAADGQCGTILKAYREYRQSGDRAWLDQMWPGIKKAMGYAFQTWDPDADGVFEGPQWNTYDCYLYGHNTFVSGLYLAALRATEEMAKIEGDAEFARECRARFEKGQKKLDEELWNGEYYIQAYDAAQHKQHQYGPGCHADQLLGQWWAHILDLGYILPAERVRTAMRSIYKYNFRSSFAGFLQQPRIYARDDEAGLLTCAWPRGGRPGPGPNDVTRYSDEIWTGIEYAVAGALLYEGLVDEGLAITRTVRQRQDGARRSPWNEVECGDHYARPMSSWTLLEAAMGLRYDAAASSVGIAPRLAPRDLRAFFIGPKGWGTLAQSVKGKSQTESLRVTYGTVELRQLFYQWLGGAPLRSVTARAGSRQVAAEWTERDGEVTVTLGEPAIVADGQALEVTLRA